MPVATDYDGGAVGGFDAGAFEDPDADMLSLLEYLMMP
jgi:hypothetical protein